MAQHLLAGPSTAAALVAAAARACGNPDGDPCYRFTDRWLQKLRRQGFARHFRDGRRVFWSYTPEGFQVLHRMTLPPKP